MRRALIQNLALSALSALFAFGVLEVAARLLVQTRGGKEQREAHRYATYDPVLGWRKTPGRQVAFNRRDFVTTITINSEGLRDPERALRKPSGQFRVVALGDSFVEAFMMKDDETPTAQLRADLGGPKCDVDVINGGTFGYSTDQEYVAYDRDLHRYQPDVVVLFAYHNDVPPLLWGPDKPVLDFSREPPVVANEPVTSRFPNGMVSAGDRPVPIAPAPGAAAEERPFLRSEAWAQIQERLETAPPSLRERLEAVGLVSPLRPFDLSDELLLYARQPPEHLLRAIKVFQQTLGALKRRVEKDGARLLVAYIPARFEVNPEDWERTLARYRIGNKKFDPRSLVFRLMTAASQENVEFVDLTDALKRTRGLFARPYFATDSHWNARGAAAGAQAVGEKLRQLRWTPECARRD